MSDKNWLEVLAAGITVIAGALAIAEYIAPRCPRCNAKLIIINNYHYCNNCYIYPNSQ